MYSRRIASFDLYVHSLRVPFSVFTMGRPEASAMSAAESAAHTSTTPSAAGAFGVTGETAAPPPASVPDDVDLDAWAGDACEREPPHGDLRAIHGRGRVEQPSVAWNGARRERPQPPRGGREREQGGKEERSRDPVQILSSLCLLLSFPPFSRSLCDGSVTRGAKGSSAAPCTRRECRTCSRRRSPSRCRSTRGGRCGARRGTGGIAPT